MIIKKVVKSQTEPSTSCIWVKGNSLYQHINGKWTKFGQAQEDQLNDLQIDNNLHNEFFWAYYKAHPEEIVNLPKETISKYFPDIVTIIEPLDGTIAICENTKTRSLITANNGIITKDMVRQACDDLQYTRTYINLVTYNCSAVKYWNMELIDDKFPLIHPSTIDHYVGLPEPENKLKLIEGIVNWQAPKFSNTFSWWGEGAYSGSMTSQQFWWNEEKLTFNGNWYFLNKYNLYDDEHRYSLLLDQFLRITGTPDIERGTLIEFNGTMYIENLYMTWDMRPNYWGNGLLYFFQNLKCYQYPTIDLTNYTYNQLGKDYKYEIWKGHYLYKFITNTSKFTWIPERPQKCLIKGFGNTINMPADLWGIIDWDYDDMIASLITYSLGKYKCNISQTSFDKLTEDDLAAIVAINGSVSVSA